MSDEFDTTTEYTQEELDEAVREMVEAQDEWDEIAYMVTPKMPCPECGGQGAIDSGSLGAICVRCNGARVVDHPAAERIELPDFAAMKKLTRAADRWMLSSKSSEEDRERLKLPPPGAAPPIPTVDYIKGLRKEAAAKAKALPAPAPVALPPAEPVRKAIPASLGHWSDEDLDELEGEEQD